MTAYHSLPGIFELLMGALLIVSAVEPGPYVYWLATAWALIGGALILCQAMLLREKIRSG